MVGFRKGALGSPWSRETYSNDPMDIGDAEYGEGAPRIGSGVLGERVKMEVQRDGSGPMRRGRRGRGGRGGDVEE
ncbi:MAG: hypothetical protein KGL39_24210 [Patescibacteria group bacterium]|nr:hypothetical protein [Patescibacteria group bacterium]